MCATWKATSPGPEPRSRTRIPARTPPRSKSRAVGSAIICACTCRRAISASSLPRTYSGLLTSRQTSAAQAEAVDQGAVTRHVDLGDVLEQAAAPTDQQQQSAPRVMVVLVHLE